MAEYKQHPKQFVDPALLSKIDKLFACRVGEYVALPQIVVVGDQSSGKSSVLQGLTKLPFPRDSGLCTRFCTQITFRRAKQIKISISILPAKGSSPDRAETIKAWYKNDAVNLDEKKFVSIMEKLNEVMGLGSQNKAGSKGSFSEGILKLDISGPDQEHFSVIDVPGIFRKTTLGVTTESDKQTVRSMAQRFMENPRSVILTVVPSNVDVATQEILTMAEEADKDGNRTLGVLTKPNLVDKGAEGPVIDLLDGKKHVLRLGWCVVRNPGQQQIFDTRLDRDSAEMTFFATNEPWNVVDKSKVGIASLQIRLRDILAKHIRREFPNVKSEIQKLLSMRKQERQELGAKRETSDQQSSYLLDISICEVWIMF